MQKRSRTKEREEKWGKTKRRYTKTAMEKKIRKHEMPKKKERMEKWERRKRREKQKRWTKRWKEKVNKEQSDERNSEHVERKSETKTKNEGFLAEFLMWFKVKREKDLIRDSSLFCLSRFVTFVCCVSLHPHVIHVRLTRTVTGIDHAVDRLAMEISI